MQREISEVFSTTYERSCHTKPPKALEVPATARVLDSYVAQPLRLQNVMLSTFYSRRRLVFKVQLQVTHSWGLVQPGMVAE